jgi:hypothetical protein
MHDTIANLERLIAARLKDLNHPGPQEIAWATIWLEACGYTGLKFLAEALRDEQRILVLERDPLGFDLQNVSCAYLAPAIMRNVSSNGRVFLRNVRHGLFMLPFAVRANLGIGCPVDPGFAVGGERHKNPYAGKLAQAETNGLTVDDAQWNSLLGAAHQ